jgi:hypothetical protein
MPVNSIHQTLVLRPSCVVKGGRKQKRRKSKMIFPYGIGVIKCSLPKGIKQKIRQRKLRNVVYWQGALKQKRVKK